MGRWFDKKDKELLGAIGSLLTDLRFILVFITVGGVILVWWSVDRYAYDLFTLHNTSNSKRDENRHHETRISADNKSRLRFSSQSNGYDWKASPIAYRKEYCDFMAQNLQEVAPGITGDFLFGSLTEFYRSTEPSVLDIKIVEIISLTAAVISN